MTIEVTSTISTDALVDALMAHPTTARTVYALLGERLSSATPEKVTLGDALKAHMFHKRLTRRDLATQMGISYPYLCELLHDKKTPGKAALDGLTSAGVDTSNVRF